MKSTKHKLSGLVLIALSAILVATSSFAMVRDVSFRELTELSETTMEVVVVNSYAQGNAERTAIFTHYVVEPLRPVGGTTRGARFELLFAGGTAEDGKQMIVTEVPTLEVGGQYILFLHPSDTRYASPTVGMWQGALRVVRDPESNELVLVDTNGNLIEKGSDGELRRGRKMNVDEHGFMTAAVVQPELDMEAEPVLRDPAGRVVPMSRENVIHTIPVASQPVHPDT
ncbi:MAG: hypothetical protein ACSLFQ_21810, partial [Thermoanaerobaculia bacterium]